MKIAIISGIFNKKGGVPRCVAQTAECAIKRHEVHLITGDYDYKIGGLHVHSFPALSKPILFRFLSNAIKNEILLKILDNKFNFDLIVNQCCESFTQDIVTAHSCHIAWVDQYNREKGRAFPLRPVDWAILAVEKQNYKKGNYKKIISVSEIVKNEIMKFYNIPEYDIAVIPNGVDINEFNFDKNGRENLREKLKINENDILLMFAGYEFERKGLRNIIEALSTLPEEVKLVVVGKDNPFKYQKLALELNVHNRVIFVGFVRKIQEYYAASDIFVFPTRYEPFGLAITEAMASGLPVITSKIAGAAEIMTDSYDCLLLEKPRNSTELADKIRELISDERFRANMGKNARKTAEKYSWDNVAEKTVEVYEEVARS